MLYKTIVDYFKSDKRVAFPHRKGSCSCDIYGALSQGIAEVHHERDDYETMLTIIHEFVHLDDLIMIAREHNLPGLPWIMPCSYYEDWIDPFAEDILNNNPRLVGYIRERVPELNHAMSAVPPA